MELAESYEPEEFTILAVTGPKGFRRAKSRGQELWKTGTNLTAWRKENEAIQTKRAYLEVSADGAFDFWFGDGDMFYGHSIRVWGSLEKGPTDASMEG